MLDKNIDPKISSMIEPAGIAQYCIERSMINNRKENNILILGCGAISMLISSLLNSMGIKILLFWIKKKIDWIMQKNILKLKT